MSVQILERTDHIRNQSYKHNLQKEFGHTSNSHTKLELLFFFWSFKIHFTESNIQSCNQQIWKSSDAHQKPQNIFVRWSGIFGHFHAWRKHFWKISKIIHHKDPKSEQNEQRKNFHRCVEYIFFEKEEWHNSKI